MSAAQPPASISPFERIRHHDDAGEYWSARELSELIGYKWQNFEAVVKKAMTACAKSSQQVSDHFTDISKMVTLGSGARRKVRDYHLSRYACYLIIENGDPDKDIVALGQTYFAIRTRRDELASDADDARKRLQEREKLKRYHRVLFRAARMAGVMTPEDFAVFEDHGYRGLYLETAAQIAERKDVPPGQRISEYMGTVELAANGFRAALAGEMLVSGGVNNRDDANATHFRAGTIVRRAMQEAGVPMPELLPTPAKSAQQVKRELARQARIEAEDRLGLWAQLAQSEAGDQSENE